MIELTETAFGNALQETLDLGKELEREHLVFKLNNDVTLKANITADLLEYIVELIEDNGQAQSD